MDKFILKVYANNETNRGEVIRIDNEAINAVREIQRQTGLSRKYIVSEAVKFASSRLEIIEIGGIKDGNL